MNPLTPENAFKKLKTKYPEMDITLTGIRTIVDEKRIGSVMFGVKTVIDCDTLEKYLFDNLTKISVYNSCTNCRPEVYEEKTADYNNPIQTNKGEVA